MPTKTTSHGNARGPSVTLQHGNSDEFPGALEMLIATEGDAAHDAVDTGSPVKVGGKAVTGLATALPTAVSNGDRVNALLNEYGQLQVIAGGITDVIDVTITRPADTSQYAAGDVIGDVGGSGVMTITGAARVNGGSGMISSVTVIHSVPPGTAANLELWLFDTAPAGIADNAAWAPSDAEAKRLLGFLDLDNTPLTTTLNCIYRVLSHNPVPFKCLTGSKDLYCVLVERGTRTPAASEVFTIRIGVSRD